MCFYINLFPTRIFLSMLNLRFGSWYTCVQQEVGGMAFIKKFLKSRPVCKVRFKIDAKAAGGCDKLFLVGSFNGWNEKDMPMRKLKDGSFSLEIELPSGEKHYFRYLRSDGVWLNDEAADAYEVCDFGAENCVLYAKKIV